jgi:hypothetical protein
MLTIINRCALDARGRGTDESCPDHAPPFSNNALSLEESVTGPERRNKNDLSRGPSGAGGDSG